MFKTKGSWSCLFHPGYLSDLRDNGWNSEFCLHQSNTPQIPTSATSAAISRNESKAVNYPDTSFIALLFIVLRTISEDT